MNDVMEVIKVMTPYITLVIGALLAVIGWLSMRMLASMRSEMQQTNTNVSQLAEDVRTESQNIVRVEKSLLELKADLPREYVRREDFIRYSAVIETKLDRQADNLVNMNINMQRLLDRREEPNNE